MTFLEAHDKISEYKGQQVFTSSAICKIALKLSVQCGSWLTSSVQSKLGNVNLLDMPKLC